LKERPDDWDALREEVEWETSARRFEKYYARIQDQGGHVLIETPGMDKIVGPALFPKPIDVHETPQKGIKRKGRDGKSLLLMGAWAETGHARSEKRLHQVALDISHEEAILSDYRRNMSIMLLAGTIFSIAMSIFVARKGIRPLDQITKAAQRITATQLHERIAPAPWPKELAALATAFDGMLTRLEDSFTRLSQFSSDLAHELRTPINNLMGEAEVALSKTRTAEQYRQVIESSLEEFGRLARMIEGLLFLARTERADTRIVKTLFDARQELETVREFYEAVAKEQGIEVSCEGNAWIDADATLFRRAINNLLSNALQYTPRGINSCRLPVIFCFELRAWMEKHIATWCTLPMANSARERDE
jgi:two-component system heavy metal sensor histidine kinase CusS